jgi:hypothetical protein
LISINRLDFYVKKSKNNIGCLVFFQTLQPSGANNAPNMSIDNTRVQRDLIAQLESKNKEIMNEIQRLRRAESESANSQESPALMSELLALRQRKGELEGHLSSLQDSRRHLMGQLEGLMKMLKNHQTSSPRSTPNSSPRSGKSPPIPQGPQAANARPLQQQQQQQQQPQQPAQQMQQMMAAAVAAHNSGHPDNLVNDGRGGYPTNNSE